MIHKLSDMQWPKKREPVIACLGVTGQEKVWGCMFKMRVVSPGLLLLVNLFNSLHRFEVNTLAIDFEEQLDEQRRHDSLGGCDSPR